MLTRLNRVVPATLCVVSALLLTACDKGGGGDAGSSDAAPADASTAAPAETAVPATDASAVVQEFAATDKLPSGATAPTVRPVGTEDDVDPETILAEGGQLPKGAERPNVVSTAHLVVARPANLDLGPFPTGETKTGIVKLVNTGDRPMTIGKPRSTCGCTTIQSIEGTVLEPGDEFDVEVRMKGGNVARVLNKSVTFNIEGQPPLVVPVRGEAIAFVEIEPKQLDPEVHTDGRLVLRSVDDEPFRVINMIPRILDEFPAEASTEVELFLPWDKFGDVGMRRKLIVYTDHPRCQQVYVDIKIAPQANTPTADNRKPNAPVRPTGNNYAQMIANGQHEEILKQIDSGKIDVNERDASGAALLGVAARNGNIAMVEALIDGGADTELADRAGRTPLMSAQRVEERRHRRGPARRRRVDHRPRQHRRHRALVGGRLRQPRPGRAARRGGLRRPLRGRRDRLHAAHLGLRLRRARLDRHPARGRCRHRGDRPARGPHAPHARRPHRQVRGHHDAPPGGRQPRGPRSRGPHALPDHGGQLRWHRGEAPGAHRRRRPTSTRPTSVARTPWPSRRIAATSTPPR